MSNSKKIYLLFVIAVCVFLGCESGDSTIDGSEPLSDLNATERFQICQEWADTINAVVTEEVLCLDTGIGEAYHSGGDEEYCQEVYEICMEEGDEYYAGCDQDEINDDDLSGCKVTVDELRMCMEDWADAWQDVVEGLSCSSDVYQTSEPPLPPSCEPIADYDCSDIIDASYPGDPGE